MNYKDKVAVPSRGIAILRQVVVSHSPAFTQSLVPNRLGSQTCRAADVIICTAGASEALNIVVTPARIAVHDTMMLPGALLSHAILSWAYWHYLQFSALNSEILDPRHITRLLQNSVQTALAAAAANATLSACRGGPEALDGHDAQVQQSGVSTRVDTVAAC
jgi:hypothetical protein